MLHVTKGNNLAYTLTRLYKGKKLNHQIALCWQEMPIIFINYFIQIIIVEKKYFKNLLLLFACSVAEPRLIVITVQNDLLRNVPRNIGQMGQFQQYLSLVFY